VAAVSNATDGSQTVEVTGVSYGGLSFTRLVGGSIPGLPFSSEFWGAHSPTARLADTLMVTMSAASNVGIHVWVLDGVNATNAVGSVISQGEITSDIYQESFTDKRSGSLLFGAFFDANYVSDASGFVHIVPQVGSVVGQTNAGYYVWSESPSSSGSQSIGAILPGVWSLEHSAVEIVP
jgi:hypothetical protein